VTVTPLPLAQMQLSTRADMIAQARQRTQWTDDRAVHRTTSCTTQNATQYATQITATNYLRVSVIDSRHQTTYKNKLHHYMSTFVHAQSTMGRRQIAKSSHNTAADDLPSSPRSQIMFDDHFDVQQSS